MNEAIDINCFDAAECLADEETIAAYLLLVANEGDAAALAEGWATVARARDRNTGFGVNVPLTLR